MTIYKQTREFNSGIKDFRLKLIELCVLSLSAIFILLTFSQNKRLLWPALIIIFDVLLLCVALSRGANLEKELIEFGPDGQSLKSKVEMYQLTYEMTKWEEWAIAIYTIAIIWLSYVMLV